MKTDEVVSKCEGVTARKLHYWCNRGVFGERLANPGNGRPRDFTDEDFRIAVVLGKLSLGIEEWFGYRAGCIALYVEVAKQVREQASVCAIHFSPGTSLFLDIDTMSELELEVHDA